MRWELCDKFPTGRAFQSYFNIHLYEQLAAPSSDASNASSDC